MPINMSNASIKYKNLIYVRIVYIYLILTYHYSVFNDFDMSTRKLNVIFNSISRNMTIGIHNVFYEYVTLTVTVCFLIFVFLISNNYYYINVINLKTIRLYVNIRFRVANYCYLKCCVYPSVNSRIYPYQVFRV